MRVAKSSRSKIAPTGSELLFAYVCAVAGDAAKARTTLARLRQRGPEVQYHVARVHAVLGEVDQALGCLKAAAEGGYRRLQVSFHYPDLADLPAEKARPWLAQIGGSIKP